MKNAIRCCISCILPCGALDVIRIVHSNGRVEEITASTIKASDVMKAYPKHILKKPSHHHHAIVVVPPDALLQRGKIYFLIPVPSPSKKKTQQKVSSSSSSKRENSNSRNNNNNNGRESNKSISVRANLVFSGDQYLSEILSEKVSTQKERRRGRVAVWRPHLESISETLSEAASTATSTSATADQS